VKKLTDSVQLAIVICTTLVSLGALVVIYRYISLKLGEANKA
jgi:hypothetical protein